MHLLNHNHPNKQLHEKFFLVKKGQFLKHFWTIIFAFVELNFCINFIFISYRSIMWSANVKYMQIFTRFEMLVGFFFSKLVHELQSWWRTEKERVYPYRKISTKFKIISLNDSESNVSKNAHTYTRIDMIS